MQKKKSFLNKLESYEIRTDIAQILWTRFEGNKLLQGLLLSRNQVSYLVENQKMNIF